jgi:hypothetical protein
MSNQLTLTHLVRQFQSARPHLEPVETQWSKAKSYHCLSLTLGGSYSWISAAVGILSLFAILELDNRS